MTEQQAQAQWVFLVDPAWQPASGYPAPASTESAEDADKSPIETPPVAAVVGGWLVSEDGELGRFTANPDYEPATPDSPTDPVDAALRMAANDQVDTDALFAVMRESAFGVAVDDDEQPIIAPAPDEVPSLLVTTAPAHRARVGAPGWRDVSLEDLARLVGEHEVDALINPGAATSTRLLGSVISSASGS